MIPTRLLAPVLFAVSSGAPAPVVAAPETRVDLAASVLASRSPGRNSTVLYVEYPSGKTVREPASYSPSTVRMILRPAGAVTRTEGTVSRALTARPHVPSGRPWLEREIGDERVYKYRTRMGDEPETRVFTGGDGSLVGVEIGYGVLHTNKASRRYMRDIEVLYQYPRDLEVRSMDEFVLKFLRQNVSAAK